jgi:hypothetical protein
LVSSARRWREPRSWPGRSHRAPRRSRRPRSWPRPSHLGGGADAESSPGLGCRGDGDARAIPSAGDPLLISSVRALRTYRQGGEQGRQVARNPGPPAQPAVAITGSRPVSRGWWPLSRRPLRQAANPLTRSLARWRQYSASADAPAQSTLARTRSATTGLQRPDAIRKRAGVLVVMLAVVIEAGEQGWRSTWLMSRMDTPRLLLVTGAPEAVGVELGDVGGWPWAPVKRHLIIRLIIQTIRWDRSGSDQIDDPSNLSRPDPSGAD